MCWRRSPASPATSSSVRPAQEGQTSSTMPGGPAACPLRSISNGSSRRTAAEIPVPGVDGCGSATRQTPGRNLASGSSSDIAPMQNTCRPETADACTRIVLTRARISRGGPSRRMSGSCPKCNITGASGICGGTKRGCGGTTCRFAACCPDPIRIGRTALPPEVVSVEEPVSAANATVPGSGAARLRRSPSARAAWAMSAACCLRRRRDPAAVMSAVSADMALKARNIHMPVANASTTPRTKGSRAASRRRPVFWPCSAKRTVSGSKGFPGGAGASCTVPGICRRKELYPNRMLDPSVTAAVRTRRPSTHVPFADPRSRIVTDSAPTNTSA